MSDKDDRTVSGPMPKCVHAAYQIFSADLEASFWGVRVPFRVIAVQYDSRFRYHRWEHHFVTQPVDVVAWIGFVLPPPRPIHICAETVHSNDACRFRLEISAFREYRRPTPLL